MKKIISMVLVITILLSMGCLTAFAESGPEPINGPWNGTSIAGTARILFNSIVFEKPGSATIAMYDSEKGMQIYNNAVEGVTYDLKSNTLTLKDVNMPDRAVTAYFMGDDFTINVEGVCSIGGIFAYSYFDKTSSSLNITGTGTLNINENKLVVVPIRIYNQRGSKASKLSIADSVTLHVYSKVYDEGYEGEATPDSATLMSVYGTGYDTADKAFTADGKAIEGFKSDRQKETVNDRAYVAFVSDEVRSYDYKVISKSDPDGIYCAYEIPVYDEVEERLDYIVRKFLLVPGYDKYTEDLSFGSYGGKHYSAEDFEKEFTFAQEDKPVKFNVTSEWREKNFKGENDVKLKKLDDPEGVYAGDPRGTFDPYSYENPESYYISRVKWDDSQGMYVQDEDFEPFYCDTADLEAEGYQVETEEVTRNKQLPCWEKPAPFDDENYYSDYDLVKRASEPGVLYAVTYTFTSETEGSEEIEKGYYIHKLAYDSANDAYYFGADDEIRLTEEEMKEQGYAFVTETVDQQIVIKCIPAHYGVDDYGMYVSRLEKDGDQNYCCTSWYYDEDENVYYHDVYKMTYNEAEGVYYVESDDDGEIAVETDLTDAELTAKYSYVTEPQNIDLELDGYVECYDEMLYLDNSGKKYVVREEWLDEDQWRSHIYEVDESKGFKNGDKTYCFVKERPDLSIDDVKSTERVVELDSWNYRLEGKEYHHIGTGSEPVQTGAKVSGKITSYVDDSDVTVKLTGTDNNFTAEAKGKDDYSIANVPAGKYTLSVSKNNHVTREYTVTVADADVTQDVKICPKGDVTGDGKTNVQDCTSILRYVRKLNDDIDDYQLDCADVTGDKKVNVQDVTRILRHIRKLEALY